MHVSLFDADAIPPPRKPLVAAGIVGVIAVVFLLDYVTAPYFSFTPLYLLPIAAATWLAGWRTATVVALVSTSIHFGGHFLRSASPVDWKPAAWEGLGLLAMFMLFVWFVFWLHESTLKALREARIDPLTGLARRGAFIERGRWELARATRYSRALTIAYLDVDRFKAVNDQYGHDAGDQLLAAIGALLQNGVRAFDLAGRLGGDEFALLLPETNDVAAGILLQRLRAKLTAVVGPDGSPVTFSIGAVTTIGPTGATLEALLARADALMYAVKRSTRNGLRQETLAADVAPATGVSLVKNA